MAEEKITLIGKLEKILEKVLGGATYSEVKGFKGSMQKSLRILAGSITKFLDDEGLIRAASISYSLVVSFVPIMVVGLLVTAKVIEKERYFLFAREFIKKHGIPIDPEPYFNIINELLNNANAVTGIGFLVLLFSATSVLRNLEAAINTIWKVRKGRPLVSKISGFLLVMIFGPVLITVGLSMGQSVIRFAAAPAIVEITEGPQGPVVLGEKALFQKFENGKWVKDRIVDRIDFEMAKETILINPANNSIITGEEKTALLPKMFRPLKNEIKLQTFKSYAAIGEKSWIVTDSGCILDSVNSGTSWNVQCYQLENTRLLFKVRFSKILMTSHEEGAIIGNNGLLLLTHDGGKSWTPAYNENLKGDLVDIISPNKDNLMIIGDKFSAYESNDWGKTWNKSVSVELHAGKDKANLTSIRKFQNNLWITGNYGTLLLSKDNGETWSKQTPGVTPHEYRDIYFTNSRSGILIGEQGYIRYTDDGGNSWKGIGDVTRENLNRVFYDSHANNVYVTGDEFTILKNDNIELSAFSQIQKSPLAQSLLYAFGSLILPFIFIGVIFFIIYKTLPYTEVMNKAAFYGAAMTSLLWVVFLTLFKYYVSSFSKGTFAIYGTLAAIPLLLLLVYTSASIMLYGAEVAFFVQNPGVLRIQKNRLKVDDDKRDIWYGLRMLYEIYENFSKGKGSTSEAALVRICHNDYLEFYFIMQKLMKMNIVELTENKKYVPVVSASNVAIKDLISELDNVVFSVPDSFKNEDFLKTVENYFQKFSQCRDEVFGSMSFEDFYRKKSQS